MPFKSNKQRRWMYSNKPALAKRWAKKYGILKKPKGSVSKKRKTKKKKSKK